MQYCEHQDVRVDVVEGHSVSGHSVICNECGRAGANPVVANRMTPAMKEAALWVEVGGGEGLDAERISRGA